MARSSERGRKPLGSLSGSALWHDAADAVRHLGDHLRAAAADAGQHRRHPVRRRRHRRSGRQGADRGRARARQADRRAVRRPGSAVCCTAISAMSYQTERPAIDEIAPRIPITAKLAGLALIFSVLIGVPLGVISAVRQNTRLDYVLRVISLSGLSMPSFWLGLLILMAFVAYFGTIPIYTDQPTGFWHALLMLQRAGGGGRLPQFGADDAADALVDARGAAPGLHPHRALEGRLRDDDQLLPRAAERAAAGRHRDRHRGGVPDRRADRHRDRVQHSRASRASWSRRSAGATIRSCRTS